jgi:hypothetical protein
VAVLYRACGSFAFNADGLRSLCAGHAVLHHLDQLVFQLDGTIDR